MTVEIMTTTILAGMALILTGISVRSSYYILRFFAGTLWLALGVWLIKTPLVAGGDPLNNIMLTICFFCGLAMMLGMNWRTNESGEGRFNFRIPRFLGGESEEDELARRRYSARTSNERRATYRERANAAIKGRRR